MGMERRPIGGRDRWRPQIPSECRTPSRAPKEVLRARSRANNGTAGAGFCEEADIEGRKPAQVVYSFAFGRRWHHASPESEPGAPLAGRTFGRPSLRTSGLLGDAPDRPGRATSCIEDRRSAHLASNMAQVGQCWPNVGKCWPTLATIGPKKAKNNDKVDRNWAKSRPAEQLPCKQRATCGQLRGLPVSPSGCILSTSIWPLRSSLHLEPCIPETTTLRRLRACP